MCFQVDIFSFSMVIYEILTGKRPFADYENMSQVTKALKTDGVRPRLKVGEFCLHVDIKICCILNKLQTEELKMKHNYY